MHFLDGIRYTCGDTFYDLSSSSIQSSNGTNDPMKKLFSIAKVDNTLICNSPIEIPYYSSELFSKDALCFNCGVECEEQHDNFFPYCEDCNISVENKEKKINL
jgi:hypothetical protein